MQTQQRFKSDRHSAFAEEFQKVALSSNDDKRMLSIDLIETYSCGMNKKKVCTKKKNLNVTKQ